MPEQDPLSEKAWTGRVEASRSVKRDILRVWQDNVSYRKGKPFRGTVNDETVNVPEDWSRTKNKQAQLFYQIPEVKLKARRPEFMGATAVFAAALNFELTQKVHPEHMMNECLADVINASGIAICEVGYDATFEDVPLGSPDDPTLAAGGGGLPPQPPVEPGAMALPGSELVGDGAGGAPGGAPGQAFTTETGIEGPPQPPMPPTPPAMPGMAPQTVAKPIYECFYAERISPAHFLWPVEFVKSDWQKASWLGKEGYMLLAEAKRRKWVGPLAKGVSIDNREWLLSMDDNAASAKSTDSYIKYVICYYRPYDFDPEEKDPKKIKQVILVEEGGDDNKGLKKVADEDFKWQKYDEASGKWVGMTTYPIKVMTITYISDQAIPPSDSEIGRPQVKELIRARTDMQKQRARSLPLRWYDSNLIDSVIGDRLRKGKWEDMIPVNGPGEHAIGEVARAQYPQQNFEFDKIAKQDLDKGWSMGDSQQSVATPGDTTAAEVKSMDAALNTRLDFERSWVLRFFMQVAEGVAQLMQMFCDKEDWVWLEGVNGEQELAKWNKDVISGEYIFEARPDSQLRLDVTQERNQALNLYKLLRKDPLINPTGLVQQLMEVHGLDPAKGMAKQEPPKPEPAKVSYSFKGEDLVNPLVVAVMQKGPTPITAEDIQAAQALLQSVVQPVAPPMGQQPLPEGQPQEGPTGETPNHPGPVDVVSDLGRRYERSGTSVEGSRQSDLPAR